MKKIVVLILMICLAIGMFACGGGDANKVPDLTGVWVQNNSASKDTWQEATIQGETIEINWMFEGDSSKALYWAGTYQAPTTAVAEYSWTSQNDTSKTSEALLASDAATKDFKYKDGKISYEVTAMGITTTVELEKKQ